MESRVGQIGVGHHQEVKLVHSPNELLSAALAGKGVRAHHHNPLERDILTAQTARVHNLGKVLRGEVGAGRLSPLYLHELGKVGAALQNARLVERVNVVEGARRIGVAREGSQQIQVFVVVA